MGNSVQDRLTADMRAAMKSQDKPRLKVLRLLIADLQEKQHSAGRSDLSEDEELEVLRKAVKSRRDSIELAEQAGRQDVIDAETAEVETVMAYLPAMMSPVELAAKVSEVIAEVGYAGPKDTGKFMKVWMARYKGCAEGRDVQAALHEAPGP